MKKSQLKILAITAMAVCAFDMPVSASKLVTSDVPMDSKYYLYIEKLEGMGYIIDMPSGTKPYSRLDVAKWLAKIDPYGMPKYLQGYYDEMLEDFGAEIDWLKGRMAPKGRKQGFKSNVKLRSASAQLSYHKQDQRDYKYMPNGATSSDNFPNASFQPLNTNNNGYRYGDGLNGVAKVNISGSFNEHLAVNMSPRFSADRDQHGDASIEEGYAKTNLGVWGIQVGKQAIKWGSVGHNAGISINNNAQPLTMLKVNLLETHTFDRGALKFLGQGNVNFFVSKLEDNRQKKFNMFHTPVFEGREHDKAKLVGVRFDWQPLDTLSFGFERMSMVKKGTSDWWKGTEGSKGNGRWNDSLALDVRWKMPGLQLYAEAGGEEDFHQYFLDQAYTLGAYFPQLVKDGSWDLRVEYTKTGKEMYHHNAFANGWTYHEDILGNAIGVDSRMMKTEVTKFFDNGNRLGLMYINTAMNRNLENNTRIAEYQVNYVHKLKANTYLDFAVGLADIKNPEGINRKDKANYVACGLRWEY